MKYDDSQTIDIDHEPLHGGLLIKTLAVSLDPYLRSKMREASVESYVVRTHVLRLDCLPNMSIASVPDGRAVR